MARTAADEGALHDRDPDATQGKLTVQESRGRWKALGSCSYEARRRAREVKAGDLAEDGENPTETSPRVEIHQTRSTQHKTPQSQPNKREKPRSP